MPVAPELFRALGAMCEPPEPAHQRIVEALGLPGRADPADHTELFVFQLVPYASVYLGPEGMLGGEAADRVAGFWRALRLAPPPEPDHLVGLLGLYATWGELLAEALLAEAADLEPPGTPPLHLRNVPGLPEPSEDAAAFLRAVLTPVRSGLLLTRWDLVRAAWTLGLGLRAGERAFALRSLLDQDPPATLGFLAEEAARWAARHRGTEAALADIGRHWRERAEATRALLLELERAAEEATAHAATS